MRKAPQALINLINAGGYEPIKLFKLKRRDGTINAYTEHDVSVEVDLNDGDGPILYNSGIAVTPTEFSISEGTQVDSGSLEGALFDVEANFGITRQDALKGLYDGAVITVADCHLSDPSLGGVILSTQIVGDITVRDSTWIYNTRSFISYFDARVSTKIQPQCRKAFGSPECGYDLTNQIHDLSVTSINDSSRFEVSQTFERDYFRGGVVEVLTGRNSGVTFDINSSGVGTDAEIEMSGPAFFAFQVGDTLRLTRGCNKTQSDCAMYDRLFFFGGFKDVPGGNIRNQRGTRTS